MTFLAVIMALAVWPAAPSPIGLYILPDQSSLIVWSPAEGRLAVAFGAGEVRGLAGEGDLRTYGPSLGVTDPVEGTLRFIHDGNWISAVGWTQGNGTERMATRVALVEEEVGFPSGTVRLAGTLIRPASGTQAAVVFTHGSGVETRESNRVFAYLLARQGIASLVYDKRGSGSSEGAAEAPFADLADDALAGVALLARDPRIRANAIGLFGPSQGGWVSLLAASRSSDVAFVVLQSGDATSPLEQEMYRGETTLRMVAHLGDADAAAATTFRRKKFLYAITDSGRADFERALADARTAPWFRYVGDKLPNQAFWRPNGLFDPIPLLEKLHQPILAVFGGSDASKDVAKNARLMREALARGGNRDATVTVIPNANHGLFATRTGLPLERELPALTRIAPGYLDTLSTWLATRTRIRPPDPRIVPAMHIDSGHITISLDSFPWRDAAPLSVRQIEGSTVDSALRAVTTGNDDGMGTAYFPFRASLTDSLRSLKYLLVHAGGITPLRPDSLKGSLGMSEAASSAGPVRLPPSYTGDLHLSVPRGRGGLTGGGFLLISSKPLRVPAQPSRYTADDLMGPDGADYFARGTPFWNILAQFGFRVDDDPVPYVFVQWAADKDGREGYCEFRFALFRFGPKPSLVASSDYGCDV